jgi:hypothetical protein
MMNPPRKRKRTSPQASQRARLPNGTMLQFDFPPTPNDLLNTVDVAGAVR